MWMKRGCRSGFSQDPSSRSSVPVTFCSPPSPSADSRHLMMIFFYMSVCLLTGCLPQGLRVFGKFAHHSTCPAGHHGPGLHMDRLSDCNPPNAGKELGFCFLWVIPSMWLGIEEAFYMLFEYMNEWISAWDCGCGRNLMLLSSEKCRNLQCP